MRPNVLVSTAVTALLIGCGGAVAEEISGTPGAPDATTSITGKQLPAPQPEFG